LHLLCRGAVFGDGGDHCPDEFEGWGYAAKDAVFFLRGVFLESRDPAFHLPEVLVEGCVGESAAASWGFVFGGAVRGEVALGAFEEEGEDFEEDGA